jgi:hypothetical protein
MIKLANATKNYCGVAAMKLRPLYYYSVKAYKRNKLLAP